VPTSPPPLGDARPATWQRLAHIARSAGASIVLGSQGSNGELLAATGDEGRGLRWIVSDSARVAVPPGAFMTEPDLDAPALIQYSSGSTADPKGVVLSHRQLVANLGMFAEAYRLTDEAVVVNWMPHYHDLGFVGHLLLSIYVGGSYVGLDPLAFVERPIRWLRAITEHRGTFSSGPNFAYDLCVARITDAQKRELDLRSWRIAINGAEPVRAGTIRRFTEAFAGCGFRAEAMCPGYGMAEAAAIVAGGGGLKPPEVRCFSPVELSRGRAVELPSGKDGRWLVGCGRAVGDGHLAIVDPDQLVVCPPSTLGEIWVSSSSVGSGYWRQPEQTAATFGAQLPGAEGTDGRVYMRTGDLGFLLDGVIYVTGRRKDTLLIHGAVHHPQDLEQSVETSHPALRLGSVAAFQVDDGEEERLVVLQEVDPGRFSPEAAPECMAAIRRAVAEEHGLFVHTVCLLARGALIKTTSGKLRRSTYRAAFLEGSLPVVARWDAPRAEAPAPEAPPLSRSELLALSPDERRRSLGDHLLKLLARFLRLSPEESSTLRPDRSLLGQGMDSLLATELAQRIERDLGVRLKVRELLLGTTAEQIAGEIAALLLTVDSSEEEFVI